VNHWQEERAVRSAWIAWAILFVIAAAIMINGSVRTVVPNYREAALHWIDGADLFDRLGVGGFTYLPQSALLFLPFALLPETVGEVLWRLLIIAVFAFGVRAFGRLAGRAAGAELFPLLSLVSIPLAWSCARNGQTTLIMAGLMLFAVADIAAERWSRATLWLMLSMAFKPLSIVLILLAGALYRPLRWRVPVGMAVLFLLPFLTQHPAYVLEQFRGFLENTTTAVHVGAVEKGWTTTFNALQVAGLDVPERVQTILRLLAAIGTLGLCFLARRRHDADRAAVFLYSLAAAYLMLFSPRTENNTYAMFGPVVGVFLARAFLVEARPVHGALLSAAVLLMVAGRKVEQFLTPAAGTSWVSPLLAVCITAYLLVRLFEGPGPAMSGGGAA
jgi:hypothetical protein